MNCINNCNIWTSGLSDNKQNTCTLQVIKYQIKIANTKDKLTAS